MDMLTLAANLEKEALALTEAALGNPGLAVCYQRECFQAALAAFDLAQRVGAAGAYPKVYEPLKNFQKFS